MVTFGKDKDGYWVTIERGGIAASFEIRVRGKMAERFLDEIIDGQKHIPKYRPTEETIEP